MGLEWFLFVMFVPGSWVVAIIHVRRVAFRDGVGERDIHVPVRGDGDEPLTGCNCRFFTSLT